MGQAHKIRWGIGGKLKTLILILLIVPIVSLVWLSTRFFIQDTTALIQQMTADTTASLSSLVRQEIESATEKMRLMGTLILQSQTRAEEDSRIQDFFTVDGGFLAFYILQHRLPSKVIVHTKLTSAQFRSFESVDDRKLLSELIHDKSFSLRNLFRGESQATLLKLSDDTPVMAVGMPFVEAVKDQQVSYSHILISLMPIEPTRKIFSKNELVTGFLVDKEGRVVAHPDMSFVQNRKSLSHLDIVASLLSGKFDNGQTRYMDPDTQQARLGAFQTVGFGGLGVVAEIPEAKAFETADRVRYRAALLACVVFCLALIVGHLYANSLTTPIRALVEVAKQVSLGNFKVRIKPKTRDELGYLSVTFNSMVTGLEERDRVKDVFRKFHNREVAEKLLSGEIKLGGERLKATIFFSDVRAFTPMSEAMQPDQVVEMLNEYMAEMVNVITRYGGIIDKYIGDAIMAIWGVPLGRQDDTYCALHACLEMRTRLCELNERRAARGDQPLRIGMGLNRGEVIAGNVGCTERMEYTVIGDAVNLASRVQTLTKTYLTDLLVTGQVMQEVPNLFVVEKCPPMPIPGKTEPIDIYRVLGYISQEGREIRVEEPDLSGVTRPSRASNKSAA